MKVSAAPAILTISLLCASQLTQAGDQSTFEKRVEKSETRTRTEEGEVRQRHRVKTLERSDRDSRRDRSDRREGEHGRRGASASGSDNRGPG